MAKAIPPYERGARAYKLGRGRNPYAADSHNGIMWAAGYDHARIQEDAEEMYFSRLLDRLDGT